MFVLMSQDLSRWTFMAWGIFQNHCWQSTTSRASWHNWIWWTIRCCRSYKVIWIARLHHSWFLLAFLYSNFWMTTSWPTSMCPPGGVQPWKGPPSWPRRWRNGCCGSTWKEWGNRIKRPKKNDTSKMMMPKNNPWVVEDVLIGPIGSL